MTLIMCPQCGHELIDMDKLQCLGCGVKIGLDNQVDERAWEGFINSCKMRVFDLADHEFQQVLGLFGPSLTDPDDPGLPFTAEQAEEAQKRLHDEQVECVRVMARLGRMTQHCLITAKTQRGVIRGVAKARKAYGRKVKLEIIA